MTDEELKALKRELDEVVALRDNMTATVNRCSELLEETRRQRREQKFLVQVALAFVVTLPEDLKNTPQYAELAKAINNITETWTTQEKEQQ